LLIFLLIFYIWEFLVSILLCIMRYFIYEFCMIMYILLYIMECFGYEVLYGQMRIVFLLWMHYVLFLFS
jgi:hypothetical protein